jgi:hypothetical protein
MSMNITIPDGLEHLGNSLQKLVAEVRQREDVQVWKDH